MNTWVAIFSLIMASLCLQACNETDSSGNNLSVFTSKHSHQLPLKAFLGEKTFNVILDVDDRQLESSCQKACFYDIKAVMDDGNLLPVKAIAIQQIKTVFEQGSVLAVKAIHPSGKLLDVKAVDQNGLQIPVKVYGNYNDLSMDVVALHPDGTVSNVVAKSSNGTELIVRAMGVNTQTSQSISGVRFLGDLQGTLIR